MKELDLTNIIQRRSYPLVKLGIYANGRWQFAGLPSESSVASEGQSIYRVANKFSLVPSNVNDPSQGKVFGESGDYIGVDRTGTISLITQKEYRFRFPRKRKTARPADTSEKLKDPNYITEIVRGSASTSSNTTPRTTYTPSTSRSSGGSGGGTYGGSSGGSSGGGGGGGY